MTAYGYYGSYPYYNGYYGNGIYNRVYGNTYGYYPHDDGKYHPSKYYDDGKYYPGKYDKTVHKPYIAGLYNGYNNYLAYNYGYNGYPYANYKYYNNHHASYPYVNYYY